MNETLVDLPCQRIECDEIWSFVYSKAKNVPEDRAGEYGVGDVWTWVAVGADTKLVPSFLVGSWHAADAYRFMTDPAGRLTHRVQLTTDAHRPYLTAVEGAFGSQIDYAMLQKLYESSPEVEKRYSPAERIGTEVRVSQGDPDLGLTLPATSSARTSRCGWGCAA